MMNDPTILLSHEHEALRGQLDLLEVTKGNDLIAVLQTLERDCSVHFKREQVLFDTLVSKLGPGGHPLNGLMTEHDQISQETKHFLEMVRPIEGYLPFRFGAGLEGKIREFSGQFKAHMRHEEMVVFLLAKSRLTSTQLRTISKKILAL